VGFYGFFVEKTVKTTIYRTALAVCKVKNRLSGDFFGFYARSATNRQASGGVNPAEHAVGKFSCDIKHERLRV
jgi:hypothetical protein